MNQNESSVISDKVGITSAVLCTVHCLVIPALFFAKSWYADRVMKLPDWWERIDTVFLVVSFIAVYHSAGHTKTKEIKVALWVSWCMLAIAIIFPTYLHWMAYVASAGLITTHFINIKRISKARKALYKR